MKIISSEGTVFHVLESFKNACGNPSAHDNYSLINKYSLPQYLHNEAGYAIEHPISPSYWLEGKHVTHDEMKKLKYKEKLQDIIDEE